MLVLWPPIGAEMPDMCMEASGASNPVGPPAQ